MKILMIARNTTYSSPGGDTTQILMTAKYLRLSGIDVDVKLSNEKINYSSYDLIHFFNIIRPDDILPHILNTQKPYVISTIFVDFSEFDKKARKGFSGFFLKVFNMWQIEYFKTIARLIFKGDKIQSKYYLLSGQFNSVLYVARHARLLLPNSNHEYYRFEKAVKKSFPYKKVVNAIDPKIFSDSVVEDTNYKNHILCVGRIEGRKNQLNLIRALGGVDLQLTIIGKPALNQMSYYNTCRKEASNYSNIHFINHIEHQKLVSIYKASKVHALPSWFETTGLCSLEAAMMGCNIVITKKGDTEEYFGEMAFYCEPDDVKSIREAVIKAFKAPRNPELKSLIMENYTWDKTAKQTLEAYKFILQQ